MPDMYRRAAQRARLIADGRKALTLINAGRSIDDVLMTVSGSRARLYRAMAAARAADAREENRAAHAETLASIDPLLL